MFSWTTGEKLPSWCLLKWNAANCLMLYVYIYSNHMKRLDPSNSRYWLQAQCHLFTQLWNTPISYSVWKCWCIQRERLDPSDSCYWLQAQCHLFTPLWNTPISYSVWKSWCIQREIRSFKLTLLAASIVSPVHTITKHPHLLLCLEVLVYIDRD
jgi:hypothetical protein